MLFSEMGFSGCCLELFACFVPSHHVETVKKISGKGWRVFSQFFHSFLEVMMPYSSLDQADAFEEADWTHQF